MNRYYQHIIYEYVIDKCHLKLCGSFINPNNDNIESVLKMYGIKVKWLKIYDLWNVASLYRCILAYCSTDYLKSLTLHFEEDIENIIVVFPSSKQLAKLKPYFRQIKMWDLRFERNHFDFLTVIEPPEALRILKLDRSSNYFLEYAGISILTELHLGSFRDYFSDCSNLFQFMSQRRPRTETFFEHENL